VSQLLSTLGLIFGSLSVGYTAKVLAVRRSPDNEEAVRAVAVRLQRFSLTFITPVVLASSFWTLSWGGGTLALFPVLGAASHLAGGLAALAVAGAMRLPRRETGSMFTCGAFTNLMSFGGLAAFMFYGEEGYALAMLFRVSEPILYYAVGFPVARAFGEEGDEKGGARINLQGIGGALRDPLILRPVAAMVAGGLLNWSGVARPQVLAAITPVLVISSTTLMLLSVGLLLTVSAISRYRAQCLAIGGVKFLLLPLVLTLSALALGYGRIQGGLPLKIVATMSAMPVAFNSLIPPSLYGLDVDLASSCWLFTTGMLAVVLPVLYLVSVA